MGAANDPNYSLRLARPGDEEPLARLHITTWREAFSDRLSRRALDGMCAAAIADYWHGEFGQLSIGKFTVVAHDESDRMVGFGSAGPQSAEPGTIPGEFYMLYVLESEQRQSLGRRMIGALARGLLKTGIESANLWTPIGDTRATAFYEAIGGRAGKKKRRIGERPFRLKCRSYEWPDLTIPARFR